MLGFSKKKNFGFHSNSNKNVVGDLVTSGDQNNNNDENEASTQHYKHWMTMVMMTPSHLDTSNMVNLIKTKKVRQHIYNRLGISVN